MPDETLFRTFGLIVVMAAVFVMVGRLVRMPAIVVYLLAGVVIGPVLGLVEFSDVLDLVSETGIALLLFLVGLELSFEKIKRVGKVAVVAGIGQVVFTAAGGFILCWLLGFSVMDGIFLAVALTFSSTVVVVKLLDEKGELDTLYGRIAVGIFLVQDLVVIIMLTFLAGLGGQDEFSAASVTIGLVKAFAGMGVLLAVALLASRYLLPRPFRWASRSPEMIYIWALSWCFLLVWVAHWFGLSLEVGAFLAGLSLAQLPYNDDLRRRLHPLMNLFVAVFFVALGIRMEVGEAVEQWMPTLVLALFVLIGNPFIFMVIITRMGYGRRTAFLTSVTVAQISEFSFVFAGMGLAGGLIGAEILSITALVGVVTIAISAYMILYNHQLYEWVCRTGIMDWKIFNPKASQGDTEVKSTGIEGHVIVVGMNTLGRSLVHRLSERGEVVLAIDSDPIKLADLPGISLIGNTDYLSVLEEAGLAKAKLLVSALQIEDANDLLAYRCRAFGVPCAINVIDMSVVDDLLDLNVEYLIIPKVDGVKEQVVRLREMGMLPQPGEAKGGDK